MITSQRSYVWKCDAWSGMRAARRLQLAAGRQLRGYTRRAALLAVLARGGCPGGVPEGAEVLPVGIKLCHPGDDSGRGGLPGAALIVGYCTGMVFTRRTAPLAGAGTLTLILPLTI
jgi:hypothetical protein